MLKKQPLNFIAATLHGCAALFFFLSFPFIVSCSKPLPQICTESHCFDIEIAQTPETREKGLMFRKALPPNTGMLFVFPKENYQTFWMKNTPLSLDILWISSQNRVVHIEKNTTPYSLKHLESPHPCLYVLELKAGAVKTYNLKPGMPLKFSRSINTLRYFDASFLSILSIH